MPINCKIAPYNINNSKDFNLYKKDDRTNYDVWFYCLSRNYVSDLDSNISNTNKLINNNNSTSEEINNYSMTLYKKDLNYTFGKILFLIVLIATYMYCFKLTGLIQPIMQLVEKFKSITNAASDTINKQIPKIKDKIPEIKQDIKNATNKLTNKIK